MVATGGPGLLNRTRECATIDRLVSSVRDGASGGLVVRGEAGIGKTGLLRDATERANGFRVAPLVGVQAEMELVFAGLHQLVRGNARPDRGASGAAAGCAAGCARHGLGERA